jgi:hypothetical protein
MRASILRISHLKNQVTTDSTMSPAKTPAVLKFPDALDQIAEPVIGRHNCGRYLSMAKNRPETPKPTSWNVR